MKNLSKKMLLAKKLKKWIFMHFHENILASTGLMKSNLSIFWILMFVLSYLLIQVVHIFWKKKIIQINKKKKNFKNVKQRHIDFNLICFWSFNKKFYYILVLYTAQGARIHSHI